MANLILHHYPGSPFAEKVRLLLGYKKLAYQAVTIPVIMPKPDLTALTGGYRRTPVLQIGADIYCDTALICKVIDRLAPTDTIYPAESLAAVTATAQWTDTTLFKISVSVAFQPRALASSPLFQDPEAAAAFMADRAKLTDGGAPLIMDSAVALPYFLDHLANLETQLEFGQFMYGSAPTIADFSTYHCLWFIHGNESIRDTFDPYPGVVAWLGRMGSFGQGELTEIAGSVALDIAQNAAPAGASSAITELDQLVVGDEVEVMPSDYGLQPVRGRLQVSSLEEFAIGRDDDTLGQITVHFPRLGFQIKKVG